MGVGEKAVIAVATNADEQNNLIEIQKSRNSFIWSPAFAIELFRIIRRKLLYNSRYGIAHQFLHHSLMKCKLTCSRHTHNL